MRVIGTAGHVDHGKSALVLALTGMDPDRLQEEKRRGLTIELGFAWMTQEADGTGERIGLIDVPGHLDFIRNMLAGITGIDASLLVVAADEGVMPQTREHLAILDLLQIPVCLPVLTKVDAVDDAEWLELVEMELTELLETSRYSGMAITQVSAHTGQGMDMLARRIRAVPAHKTGKVQGIPPRLPVDRVFTRRGFGTVVTGTLVAGSLAVGDDVQLLPSGQKGRIRGLQAYHQAVEHCEAGMRVAVNVSGIAHADVQRGHTLCHPGTWQGSRLLDVKLQQLPQAGLPLGHDMEVVMFHGAAEIRARVRTIGDWEIAPGAQGFGQLVLATPAVVGRGDRFIVRLPSPSMTLGGGQVLDAPAARFWKRFTDDSRAHFQALSSPDPGVRLIHQIGRRPFLRERDAGQDPEYRDVNVTAVIEQAVGQQRLLRILIQDENYLVTVGQVKDWQACVLQALEAGHCAYPLRRGQQRGELQSTLTAHVQRHWGHTLTAVQFTCLLSLWREADLVQVIDNMVALPGHKVTYAPHQQAAVQRLAEYMAVHPFQPPPLHEIRDMLNHEASLLESLVDSGEYVLLGSDVLFTRTALQQMHTIVMAMLDAQGTITMAQVRDRLQASRKHVQALLEHMDAEQLTRRQGDVRVHFQLSVSQE